MNSQPVPGVLSFEQATEIVERYCAGLIPGRPEQVSLLQALGRTLAEPVLADRDFPPFPRATRDGYAVHAHDLATLPASLRVVGQIKAGDSYPGPVSHGEAVEIMTGAAVPVGLDAVVMIEHTSRDANWVQIQRACAQGENIVPTGSEARAGQEMLLRGQKLGSAQIAVAAATGKTAVSVFQKPKIAILSTGDEVVDISRTPGPYQIRNSNSYSLAAQVILAGGEPLVLPIAPDEKKTLKKLVQEGLKADLLLLSGGVSMGKYDLVEQVLESLGARFFFTGALIQPGRPVVFGEVAAPMKAAPLPFFGLPGNPLSTMVTFDLFARCVVEALAGAPAVRLPAAQARLAKEIKTRTGLTRFLPGMLSGGAHDARVEVARWQGSGDLMAIAGANCYVVIPPDKEYFAAGDLISVVMR